MAAPPPPAQGARPQQTPSPAPAPAASMSLPRPIPLRGPRREGTAATTPTSPPVAPASPPPETEPSQPRPRLVFLPEREAAPSPAAEASPTPTSLPAARGPRPAVALATRVASGMAPLLNEAHRVSHDALIPEPSAPSAPSQATGVQNTFNVNVHLGSDEGGAGLDRTALEQVLVEILREAARRNGLEV